jgi:cytochrome c oxidase assembly protein subunit 15
VQFATGLSNIVLQWPLALAVLHTGGAAVLLGILVACNVRVWRIAPAPVKQPALRPEVTGAAR